MRHGDTRPSSPLNRRRAGILLHPTSLPGPGPHGDLGRDAHAFVDLLAEAGVTVWQMLPLGPTHEDGSPYQCLSAHAGDTRLVNLAELVSVGWLDEPPAPPAGSAAYRQFHDDALRRTRAGFLAQAGAQDRDDYAQFCAKHADWLDDYVLFVALRKEHGGRPWWQWESDLRGRAASAVSAARSRLDEVLEQLCFEQYLFYRQFRALKGHANARGIQLFGDIPIFVALDSADVWASPQLFDLDAMGNPRTVAGVPPDYFSATGQRWGNPLYVWERMREDGFRWWKARVHSQHELFDLMRIDHFRGFEAYWEIPASEPTAMHGHWVKAPGEALFEALLDEFGELPLVAEDLGVITPEVEALRDRFSLPGMKILQFAFDGGPANPYLCHNHVPNCVVYTGTHDNDTTAGWFEGLSEPARGRVLDYLGKPCESMPWPLIRLALASVARLAVLPMQDVLGLGSEARMNTPGTTEGNWGWRFAWSEVPAELAPRLRRLIELYGR